MPPPSVTATFEPRATCGRCRRPMVTCYCAHVPSIEPRTRVVILQHRRERDVPIGTAHMASLCLRGAELVVGVEVDEQAAVRAAIDDPTRPAYVLFPGEGARDVDVDPPTGPITLVVVDGTWALAKKLLRVNPRLAALPRLAFTPPAPSGYRIRKEPRDDYVSTIEAVAHVLGALEGDRQRFAAMLGPFKAMVDAQIDHRARIGASRHRRSRRATAPKPVRGLPNAMRERPGDLLYVSAEANAWSRREGDAPADELVHWLAYRPATGERFEALIAPSGPISPGTPAHTGLSVDELRAGQSLAAALENWARFVRATDVLCSWGLYGPGLLAAAGGVLPSDRVDLRSAACAVLGRKTGLVEQLAANEGLAPAAPLGRGRGGLRLALLVEAGRALLAR